MFSFSRRRTTAEVDVEAAQQARGLQAPLRDGGDDLKEPETAEEDDTDAASSNAPSAQRPKFRRVKSTLRSRSLQNAKSEDGQVAFTVLVRDRTRGDLGPAEPGAELTEAAEEEHEATAVDIMHEAVHGAVQTAMQGTVNDVVAEAVNDAIQTAFEEPIHFNFRANFFTLVAITGVVLYWRGIWTLWDYFFGFAIWSEVGAVGVGLCIMMLFRLVHLPLLQSLPGG